MKPGLTFATARFRWFLPRAFAVIVAVCLPFIAYSTTAQLTASRAFVVEAVELSGNERVEDADLLEVAGFGRARNILTLDPVAIRDGLQAHPWVRTADVDIDLRQRRVDLRVEERELAAIAVHHEPVLIDRHGEVIRPWRASDGLGVPVLVGATDAPATLRAMLDVCASLANTRLAERAPVVEVHDRGVHGFRVLLADGFELLLARDAVDARVARVDEALARGTGSRRATYALANGSDPLRIVVGHETSLSTALESAR